MAPRPVLQELAQRWPQEGGVQVHLQALGGVELARRVAQGEPADAVVLASDALEGLMAQGHLRAQTRCDLMRSKVAVAWSTGRPAPDLSDLASLERALLAARAVAYSTGPSGQVLLERLAQWGLLDRLRDKLVQAPPGVPVGQLLAQGQAELGFQQRSELMGLPGIESTLLPPWAEIVTVFSGAISQQATQPELGRAWLAFCSGMQAALSRHGMAPV